MEKNQIGKQIWQQLGGNQFYAMTGSKALFIEDGVKIILKPNRVRARYLVIRLQDTDTYSVKFLDGSAMKVRREFTGVYCDQLRKIFTEVTGMDTHL